MAFEGGSVEIQIKSSADKARAALESLSNTVRNIRTNLKSLSSVFRDLNKSITGFESSVKKIQDVASTLKEIQNVKFDATTTANLKAQFTSLTPILNDFSRNMSRVGTETLKDVAKLISALNAMPKAMVTMQSLDTTKIGQVFSTLSAQIQPFLSQLKEASAELQAFAIISNNLKKISNGIDEAKKSVKNLGSEAKKSRTALNSMLSIGKIYFFLNYTKRASQALFSMFTSAMDFIEVENLFSRSMGSMRAEAIKFQNTMAEVFGLALPDMMKSQALFNNIVKQLGGINEEMSYGISETLTKMSIDFAALYNVQIDKAFDTFQAAMTGQVKPVRRIAGMDITQATLQAYLDQAGIDRTIRNLNQVEKRLLTVYSLQRQMAESQAIGSYAQEIENAANQLKILSEQVKEFGRWISSIFVGAISGALPYLNGFVMVLKEIAKTLAFFVGYKMPDSSNLNNQLGLEDAADGLDDVADGVEKIKQATTGIDELNIIAPEQATVGAGEIVDPAILGLLTEYDNLMADVQMKAIRIRDAIMEWLGFTKIINTLTGEISWDFNADKLWNSLSRLAGVDLTNLRNSFERLFDSLKPFVTTIGDGLHWLYKSVLVPLAQWTIGTVLPVFLDGLSGILKILTGVIKSFIDVGKWLVDGFLGDIARWTGGVIVGVLKGLAGILNGIGDWMAKNETLVNTWAKVIATILASLLAYKAVNSILKTVGVALLKFGINASAAAVKIAAAEGSTLLLSKNLTLLKNGFKWAIDGVIQFGKALWAAISAHPILATVAALSALATVIGVHLYSSWKKTQEEMAKKEYERVFSGVATTAEEMRNALDQLPDSSGRVADAMEKHASKISELKNEYKEAETSVDMLITKLENGKTTVPGAVDDIYNGLIGLSNIVIQAAETDTNAYYSMWSEAFQKTGGEITSQEEASLNQIIQQGKVKKDRIKEIQDGITEIHNNAGFDKVTGAAKYTAEELKKLNDFKGELDYLLGTERRIAERTKAIEMEQFLQEFTTGKREPTQEALAELQSMANERIKIAKSEAAGMQATAQTLWEEAQILFDKDSEAYKEAENEFKNRMATANKYLEQSVNEATVTATAMSNIMTENARKELEEYRKVEAAILRYRDVTSFLPPEDYARKSLEDRKKETDELIAIIESSGLAVKDLFDKYKFKSQDTFASLSSIVESFDKFNTNMREAGKTHATNYTGGFNESVSENMESLRTSGTTAFESVDKGWVDAAEEHSPSKVAVRHGINFIQGLIDGLDSFFAKIRLISAVKNVATKITDTFKTELSEIKNIDILSHLKFKLGIELPFFLVAVSKVGTLTVDSLKSSLTPISSIDILSSMRDNIERNKYSLFDSIKSVLNSMSNIMNKWITNITTAWTDMFKSMSSISGDANFNIDISGIIAPNIPMFARGGFPEDGLFFANHNELIGNVAGRTAVANNDQIVASVSQGVASAVASVLSAMPTSQDNRDIVIAIDGREIARASRSGESQLGTNHMTGGFARA